MSDVTKRGGEGSTSRYYEIYDAQGVLIDRHTDVWEVNQTLLNQPVGTYKVRQPEITVTITQQNADQVQAFDVEVAISV